MLFEKKIIVVKSVKYGESDLIIQGVTTTGASLSLIARGALKSKKRFSGGVLEPTHYISINYKKKTGASGLPTLTEAKLLKGFEGLRTSYDKLELAMYMLKIIAKVSQEEDLDSKDLFDLLGNALSALDQAESFDNLRTQFQLKLLYQQGVLPPDLVSGPFLKTSIKEHSHIDMPKGEFTRLRNMANTSIKQYLETHQVSDY